MGDIKRGNRNSGSDAAGKKANALPNLSGPFFYLTDDVVRTGLSASRESPRRRIILPVHRTQDARVQRMINFLQPDTYIRPHLHPLDHAVESLVLLQGSLRFLIFDDEGIVRRVFSLDANSGGSLIDIEPRVWHSFVVMEPDTVVFETKRGPYNAKTDKKFAPWAPEEGSGEAADYVRFMKNADEQTSD